MKVYFLLGILSLAIQTIAQNNVQIIFQPKFHSENLELNQTYLLNNDTLKISNFKCYITNLTFYKNNSLVHKSSKKAHLIDSSNSNTFVISENHFFKFDEIRFNIGVDNLTSTSGVYMGDLDPAKGMYWTWQSGYINFKLEGTSNICPSRKNKFQWHIGGYLSPFNTLQTAELRSSKNNPKTVWIELEKIFEKIDISEVYRVMSPNEKATQLAKELPSLFKIFP